MSKINSFKELIVYQKAYKLAMEIFEITKGFPKDEKYSLTDQIRRSSRSVTSCIAESWAKRRYEKAFVNKLTDSLGEENETETWIDYSLDCKYIDKDIHDQLLNEYNEVRKMLISIINNPEKWCSRRSVEHRA
jgi:four helix bundle protein